MKQRKAKRKLAQALALMVCLSAPMQAASFAEETIEIIPAQQDTAGVRQEELPVPIDQPNPDVPAEREETIAPEATAAPEVPELETTPEPEATPAPEATPMPEATPRPEESSAPENTPENTIVPENTLDPEATIDPENTINPDASVDPDAALEPTPGITRNPYTGWYGVIPSDERGMPIPILYQTDYPEVVCTIRGIERSVESSGCGATSISMVIAYLTGNIEQNPYTIFCDAVEKGLYQGEGFSHSMILHYANKYGVRGEWIGKDGEAIVAALNKGMPVIAHMGPGIFTDMGHYVVLRGVTENGKILLNDPVSPYKTEKAFPLQTILTQCKGYTPFMICWNEALEEEYEALKEPAAVQHTLDEIVIELKRPISGLPRAVEVTTDLVNLRDRPGKGNVVGALPKGAKAWAIEERIMESGAFWYGIAYKGQTLYLKSEYIAEAEAAQEEIALLKEAPLHPEPEAEPTVQPEIISAAASTPEPVAAPSAESTAEPAAMEDVSAANQAPESDFEPCAAQVIAERVNLRVSPGSGDVAKTLRQGAQVYVTEQRAANSGAIWYGVIFEGETLYLKGEYLSMLDVSEDDLARIRAACMQAEPAAATESAAEPAAQPAADRLSPTMDGEFDGAYIARVNCDRANLRDHIGTNEQESLVVCSVPGGTAMYVIDEELCYEDGHVWCKVLFRGQKLYVRGDLLKFPE